MELAKDESCDMELAKDEGKAVEGERYSSGYEARKERNHLKSRSNLNLVIELDFKVIIYLTSTSSSGIVCLDFGLDSNGNSYLSLAHYRGMMKCKAAMENQLLRGN